MSADIQATGPRPSDKWIPWYFVLFFGVIFIANGFLVYFAVGSQPGVIEEHHYEIGLDYDSRLAEQKAQKALGWRIESSWDGRVFLVEVTDKQKAALSPDTAVTVEMVRPVQDGYDFEVMLPRQAAGRYAAVVDFPLPGRWDAYIYVTRGNDQSRISKSFVVDAPGE